MRFITTYFLLEFGFFWLRLSQQHTPTPTPTPTPTFTHLLSIWCAVQICVLSKYTLTVHNIVTMVHFPFGKILSTLAYEAIECSGSKQAKVISPLGILKKLWVYKMHSPLQHSICGWATVNWIRIVFSFISLLFVSLLSFKRYSQKIFYWNPKMENMTLTNIFQTGDVLFTVVNHLYFHKWHTTNSFHSFCLSSPQLYWIHKHTYADRHLISYWMVEFWHNRHSMVFCSNTIQYSAVLWSAHDICMFQWVQKKIQFT